MPALSTTGVWRDEALILDRPDDGDRSDDLRFTETHLEQITAAFTKKAVDRDETASSW